MSLDTDTLELVRKTLFGGTAGGVLDFNAAFGAAPSVSGNFDSMMAALMPGGDPGTNAGVNADSIGTNPAAVAGINAIGGLVGQAITSIATPPGTQTAVGLLGKTLEGKPPPSALSNIMSLIESIFNPQSFNSSIDPEGMGINNSGLTPQAMEGFVTDTSGDTGDSGAATGPTSGAAGESTGGDSAGGPYFNGGFVPGPDVGHDNRTITVAGGEVVIPHRIVEMLGTNFFEDLLLNTKSPAVEFAEKQAKEAEKAQSKGSK